ncbi:MAG TPA: bifunctional chorismate mutase/prephenate dehydrogenase [Gammaproteobacteria bacterium]|jgi:chorismate mutase/prephenate dehydrogenase
MNLDQLRKRLTEIDRELIRLAKERQDIVGQVGAHKIAHGVPTRDYERERDVLKGARDLAESIGLEPDLAEEIMQLLIRSSLTRQEEKRVESVTEGEGKRALVIGGLGQMGAWFVRFLRSQGYSVEIADPGAAPEQDDVRPDWRDLDLDHELIVVAAPIKATAAILVELARRKPTGLVFDIGSLKTPLRSGLLALAEAGCRVTSIHPMFGPDTRLLSGRHVIFVDAGNADATEDARRLFGATMAEQIDMSLEEHDRLIAYVLGLSHALNLAFFTALAESGELVPRLKHMSSTTFDAQLNVAHLVAHDNPHLYFEIQALNEYGGTSLDALRSAAERIQALIAAGDESGFVSLMEAGRRYLDKR